MTIPSEFDLIQIERRADELRTLAEHIYVPDRGQSLRLREIASDVGLLVAAIRELRTGGRVPSGR